ncbi:hypothetical protein UFOVP606_13 [uncultured Caudovirales phage]|uniref:Uncharacterized protein n=1 Tax=uncultured Caudovirales phage TaxID=2100421 RepID=A0A6J5N5I7_9CAUD|nr:hypothetical protein UFOVP606_13 [uncultured Caudovirales phage]
MTTQDRIAEVLSYEKTKANWRTKHDSLEFIAASNLNNELFGLPLNKAKKCKCLEDLFFMIARMNSKTIRQINTKKMAQFKLKKDKLITLHGMSDAVTFNNCTDEKAIALLKLHKGHIKNFESYPQNWEQIVFGTVPPVRIPTKKEIKERAKAIGLPASSTLEEVVEAELAQK